MGGLIFVGCAVGIIYNLCKDAYIHNKPVIGSKKDIILLETKIAKPDKKVFKLQFTVGEYDMTEINKKLRSSMLLQFWYFLV